MVKVKVLVSMDEALLARVDREARARGLTRSTYLSELAARELDARPGPGAQPAVRAALARLDSLFAGHARAEDATTAVRRERDAR